MRALIVFLAAIVPAAALAQPYKCVGRDGKVTFSQERCEADRPKVAEDFAEGEKDVRGLTAADRARIKALEAITVDKVANNEQKTAALLEAGNIRRGLESQLSAEDKAKREALTNALANKDPEKRAAALRELRTLYKE